VPEEPSAPSAAKNRPAGSPADRKQLDAKALDKISNSIAKYENQTWERLHVEQEAIRRKLFSQWSQHPTGMSSKEYHKMLTKMHGLARSSMPGELKPGDTLATLKHMLEQGKSRNGERDRKGADKEQKSAADEELVLPYATWTRCMARAKTRPEPSGKADGEPVAKTKGKP